MVVFGVISSSQASTLSVDHSAVLRSLTFKSILNILKCMKIGLLGKASVQNIMQAIS